MGAGAIAHGRSGGGVIAGTAAVASQAVSDIARGEVSDTSTYMATAFRETIIGAISGAVFGPFGTFATLGGRAAFGAVQNGFESIIRQTMEGNGFSFGTLALDMGIGGLTGGIMDSRIAKAIGKGIKSGVGALSGWVSNGIKAVVNKLKRDAVKIKDLAVSIIKKSQNGYYQKLLTESAKKLGASLQDQMNTLGHYLVINPGRQLAGNVNIGHGAGSRLDMQPEPWSINNNYSHQSSGGGGSRSGGTGDVGTPPRYGDRQITDSEYKMLRDETPTPELRDKVNEGHNKNVETKDEAIPGKTFTGSLEADHIVPMNKITKMDGFGKLTKSQQLEVLNNPDNFIGLSKSANTSKQSKSFEEWTHYKKGKKGEIEVDPEFRQKMIIIERELERKLQKQIDDLNKLNDE